jgi:hypothetical protein
MRHRLILMAAMLIPISVSAGLAQNRFQQRGGMQAGMPLPVSADPVVLTGTVRSTNMVAGQGMPSISLQSNLGDVTVLLSPYRVFLDSKFEVYQGQELEIKAFPDPRIPSFYVASEVKDVATQAALVLRNAAGVPNIGGRGNGFMGGRGAAGIARAGAMAGRGRMGGNGACVFIQASVNLQDRVQLVGTVESVDMQAGQGTPTFFLTIGETRVAIFACPYRTLLQTGFQILPGDQLSVEGYPLNTDSAYMAALINNLSRGTSVKLRDQNGLPLGGLGPGMMRGIRRQR